MIYARLRVAPEKRSHRPPAVAFLAVVTGDDMAIQAIDTEYAGKLFRSRLEARWAVFFDALGIEWEYETEGFEDDSGKRYLPDFYLPWCGYYCEVKGDPEGLRNDFERLSVVLPQLAEMEWVRGILVLGEIPRSWTHAVVHPLLRPPEHGTHPSVPHALRRGWAMFASSELRGCVCPVEDDALSMVHGLLNVHGLLLDKSNPGWLVESRSLPGIPMPSARLGEAYRKAAHARFEHGQSGAQ